MTIAMAAREREVDSRLVISDAEVDNFLAGNEAQGGNEEAGRAYLSARLESASPADPEAQGEGRAGARTGFAKEEDFAQLAAAYSDAPDGPQGGNLAASARPAARPVRRSGGEHEAGRRVASCCAARTVSSSNCSPKRRRQLATGAADARTPYPDQGQRAGLRGRRLAKLATLRERLNNGGDFAELARLYSQDGSAAKGATSAGSTPVTRCRNSSRR